MIYTGVDCRVQWILLIQKCYHKKNNYKVSNKLCFVLLFEPIVIKALTIKRICIVLLMLAASIDGRVFVEKVT